MMRKNLFYAENTQNFLLLWRYVLQPKIIVENERNEKLMIMDGASKQKKKTLRLLNNAKVDLK